MSRTPITSRLSKGIVGALTIRESPSREISGHFGERRSPIATAVTEPRPDPKPLVVSRIRFRASLLLPANDAPTRAFGKLPLDKRFIFRRHNYQMVALSVTESADRNGNIFMVDAQVGPFGMAGTEHIPTVTCPRRSSGLTKSIIV